VIGIVTLGKRYSRDAVVILQLTEDDSFGVELYDDVALHDRFRRHPRVTATEFRITKESRLFGLDGERPARQIGEGERPVGLSELHLLGGKLDKRSADGLTGDGVNDLSVQVKMIGAGLRNGEGSEQKRHDEERDKGKGEESGRHEIVPADNFPATVSPEVLLLKTRRVCEKVAPIVKFGLNSGAPKAASGQTGAVRVLKSGA
jgi:hypothetical protein